MKRTVGKNDATHLRVAGAKSRRRSHPTDDVGLRFDISESGLVVVVVDVEV